MAPLVIFTLTILSHIAQVCGRAILENRDMNNATLQLNTMAVSNATQVDSIKDNGTDADAPVWIIGLILLFAVIVIGFAVLFCRCLCCGVCCGLVFWDRSRYKTVKAEAPVPEVVDLDATEADNRAFVNFKKQADVIEAERLRSAEMIV
ncbi:hypothetical protein E8E14_012888 [Neopestalotiopsis sp. 37M]|nr:hypothetical protein E8E14_012888 [Neopestalotiopsis sp. 37M]